MAMILPMVSMRPLNTRLMARSKPFVLLAAVFSMRLSVMAVTRQVALNLLTYHVANGVPRPFVAFAISVCLAQTLTTARTV